MQPEEGTAALFQMLWISEEAYSGRSACFGVNLHEVLAQRQRESYFPQLLDQESLMNVLQKV